MNSEVKCERCNLYRRYQHPQTGKVYKLCAKCGWEALVKLCGYDDSDKSAEEKVNEVLKINRWGGE